MVDPQKDMGAIFERLKQEAGDAVALGAAQWVKEHYGDEVPQWALDAINRDIAEITVKRRLAEIEKDLDG